jgi:hypothetical protein
MRTCAMCNNSKPLSDFGVKKSMKDGLQPSCKSCTNTRAQGKKVKIQPNQSLPDRPMCKKCNIRLAAPGSHNKPWRDFCWSCGCSTKSSARNSRTRKYRKFFDSKLVPCTICGFMPVHEVQMDIDHIDGDHSNNTIENLQLICSNCHRLKTHLSEDGFIKRRINMQQKSADILSS